MTCEQDLSRAKYLGLHKNTQENREDKPPFVCSIAMGRYSVDVYSQYNGFLPYFEGQGKGYIPWIPGWKTERIPKHSGYSIVNIPDNEIRFDYDERKQSLVVHGDLAEFQDGQAFAYLGFWLTEAQRQKDSIVTSHAAVLSHNDDGALILGERGDGKTSVALALGLSYGYKLIANDLAMVGLDRQNNLPTAYDGTKIFGLRLSAVRGRFPQLLQLFPDQSSRSWTTKSFVYPNEIGMEIDTNPKKIKKVFMVHVDSTKADILSVFPMDDLWIRNYLYENFSRYLRAIAIVPFGARNHDFLDYLPSLDSRELHENRVRLIHSLIHNIGILNVSGGSLEEIRDFIHQEMIK